MFVYSVHDFLAQPFLKLYILWSNEQRSKFHMYWPHLPLTRIHTRRKLFAEVRKVSVRSNVSHA